MLLSREGELGRLVAVPRAAVLVLLSQEVNPVLLSQEVNIV